MMDSQENILAASAVEKAGKQEEVKAEEQVTETPQASEVETAEPQPQAPEAPTEPEVPEAAEAPAEPEAAEASEKQEVPEAVEAPAEPETPEAAETPAEPETPEAAEAPAEPEQHVQYNTKQEVLERVKEIAHGEDIPQKDEVDYLKTVFYKLHIAEREAKLKEYIDGGGDPEAYQITPDEDEEVFKAEMGIIKERRQQQFREQ